MHLFIGHGKSGIERKCKDVQRCRCILKTTWYPPHAKKHKEGLPGIQVFQHQLLDHRGRR